MRAELTVTSRWATIADALDGGMFARGWLPRQLPRDATNLVERHDLDTNYIFGVFSSDPSQSLAPGRLPAEFGQLAKSAAEELGDSRIEELRTGSDFAVVCETKSGHESFAIVIDRRSGNGLFWNWAHCD